MKTLKRVLRSSFLLTFLILVALVIGSEVIFQKTPTATARWEISSPGEFHIGEVIEVTLFITTVAGTTLDIGLLPDVGQTIVLPAKTLPLSSEDTYSYFDTPSTVPEGELEVVSRRIRQYSEGGLIITEVRYGLIYLLEIDRSSPSDDKLLPYSTGASWKYWFAANGGIRHYTLSITANTPGFLIIQRVDGNVPPIIDFASVIPSGSPWPYLRLAGFGCLGLSFGLLFWRAALLIFRWRRLRQEKIAAESQYSPTVQKLFENWCSSPDVAIFIEAVKLYRRGIWGRPRTDLWLVTTFVLYSGVVLNHDQAKSVLDRIVKEVTYDSA